jgi:HEAT repeat protein
MLENLLYGWLVVRLLLSIALGVRTANRLRHDAASQAELHRMVGFHLIAAGVTWFLEGLIRMGNMPVNGAPVVQAFIFPFALISTIWVPASDTIGFALVSVAVAAGLARMRLGRYRQELILGEPEQRVRAARACEFLGQLARPAIPELLEALTDPDPVLCFRAARALGRVVPHDPVPVIDALRRALADRDERVCLAAACALALLKQTNPAVAAGAVAALTVEDDEIRGEGLRAVRVLGPAAGADAPERVLAMVDHWKFGTMVPLTLGKVGPEAIPALAVLLTHRLPRIRSAAATELGKLGPRARAAVPELEARRRDRDPVVRSAVGQALRAVGR